jgi:hypothetical protein
MTQVLEITQHLEPRSTPERPKRTTSYRVCQTYTDVVTLRLTKTEKEQLVQEARATVLSLSRYIATTMRERTYPPSLPEKEVLQQSLSLLLKLGINLHALQEKGRIQDVAEAVGEVTKAVKYLRNRLKAMR